MIISMHVFGAVYSTGMLWVGEPEWKEGGLADLRLQKKGFGGVGGGVRGIFGIFQEPFQSGSRWILLPKDPAKPDRQ